jgi:hypothetical protein
MRKFIYIFSLSLILIASCRKQNDIPTSGTATLNNVLKMDQMLQTYYSMGFLFSAGSMVSTLDVPPPDINIINDGTLNNLILATNNFENSFCKIGSYPNASAAINVFDTLKSPKVIQWKVWADSIKANQVWIYKSGNEHYAKIRIVSTVSELRSGDNYSECTFDWVYQPDGSLTFPVK